MNSAVTRPMQIKLFYILICFLWFSNYVYVPILSPYCESMGASYTMVGLVLSSYGFVQLLCRLPIGILSDTLNRRKIFALFALASSAVSGAGLFLATSPFWLLIFRAMAGLAVSNWAIFITMYTSFYSADDQQQAMGTATSAMSAGQVAATFVGGLVALYISEAWTFGVAAIAAVIGFVLCFFLPEPETPKRKPLKPADIINTAKDYNLIFFSSLAILLQIALYAGIFGFVPNILRDAGADNFILGLATTLGTLPAIFSSMMAGTYFRNTIGTKNTIITAFTLLAVTTSACAFIRIIPVILILQMVGGFARGMLLPSLTSMAIKNIPVATRSTATSFFQAVYGVGMTLGPVIAGAMGDLYGITASFVLVGLITISGGAIVFFNKKAQY